MSYPKNVRTTQIIMIPKVINKVTQIETFIKVNQFKAHYNHQSTGAKPSTDNRYNGLITTVQPYRARHRFIIY
jgi:hypothetical protein